MVTIVLSVASIAGAAGAVKMERSRIARALGAVAVPSILLAAVLFFFTREVIEVRDGTRGVVASRKIDVGTTTDTTRIVNHSSRQVRIVLLMYTPNGKGSSRSLFRIIEPRDTLEFEYPIESVGPDDE